METIRKSFWCVHGSDEKRDFFKKSRFTKFCEECRESDEFNRFSRCEICDKHWHFRCVPSSPEDINHPYHPYHPLKLLLDGPPDYSNGKCDICKEELKKFVYHCSICDYSIHVRCSKSPPPLVVDAPKCHDHTLTLMARNDRFTCNACGTYGEQCPYVCAPCSLMFHRDCIKLPHVININRHDDRISLTYSFGFGDRKCPICHKKIDWRYGAYSCAKCPSFVVHSKCATRDDVWDGIELEGVPEEVFDVSPFKVIEEGVINHFSHQEHNLRIVDDGIERDKKLRCEACVHPIYSEKHYSCMKCNYTLHETCANLPLRKRHGLNRTPLTLVSTNKQKNEDFFMCDACETYSNGFRYESGDIKLDVRCVTVSYYFDYECHSHTLFLTTTDKGFCGGCFKYKDYRYRRYLLNCIECDYSLCFECATLPKKTRHRSDDHFKCVLGDFVNVKPGRTDDTRRIVSNDSISRPKCNFCRSRCKFPVVLEDVSSGHVFCNLSCHHGNVDKTFGHNVISSESCKAYNLC